MTSMAMMQPGDPRLPLTLAEAVGDYRKHRKSADDELRGHDLEAATAHATLAVAAAQIAAAFITSGKLTAPTDEWG